MVIFKYKDYEGTCEVSYSGNQEVPDDLICHGKLLFVNGLVTYEADNPKALELEFRAAVDDYIQTCAELGIESKKTLKGVFNVRVSPDLHKAVVLRSHEDNVSLNEVVNCALKAYLHPDERKFGQDQLSYRLGCRVLLIPDGNFFDCHSIKGELLSVTSTTGNSHLFQPQDLKIQVGNGYVSH